MTPNELAAAAIGFAAGVGFAILFSRWLLWNDVLIETKAHSGDDEDDDPGDDYPEGEMLLFLSDDEIDCLLAMDIDEPTPEEQEALLRWGQ